MVRSRIQRLSDLPTDILLLAHGDDGIRGIINGYVGKAKWDALACMNDVALELLRRIDGLLETLDNLQENH